MGAQKNLLIETFFLSTHNICFGWEIRKIIFKYTPLSRGLNFVLVKTWLLENIYELVFHKNYHSTLKCLHCIPCLKYLMITIKQLHARTPIQLLHRIYQLDSVSLFWEKNLEIRQYAKLRHSLNFLKQISVLRGYSAWQVKIFCNEEKKHFFNFNADSRISFCNKEYWSFDFMRWRSWIRGCVMITLK